MRIDSAVALGIAASGLLLSGCAYRQHVTRMAVDYNQFVADATNRQTVLNILRARATASRRTLPASRRSTGR